MPHEEFIYEPEDTNKGLVGRLERLAAQINMHGGVHFEKIVELKRTCQALLYQNDWINDDEDDRRYMLDIMPLIQNKVDIYNIDNPQRRSMTTIVNKRDSIAANYYHLISKKPQTQVIRHANNEWYQCKTDVTNLDKGCLKCERDDHFTSDHHSYFKRAMNINPTTVYSSQDRLDLVALKQTGRAKRSFKPKLKKKADTTSYAAAATRKKKTARMTAYRGAMRPSTSRMTQEDHNDAMDAAVENMNARNMTIDINQETSVPVLEYPPPARHAGRGHNRPSAAQRYSLGGIPTHTTPRRSPRNHDDENNNKKKAYKHENTM
jgi:hypothetical protein